MQTVTEICAKHLGVVLLVLLCAGCTTHEPAPKGQGFGHWIQIAPDRVGNILLARTPTEGALLEFVQRFVADANSPITNVKVIYLSPTSLAELSRPIAFQKDQREIPVDYHSRPTTSQDEIALLTFDEPTNTSPTGRSKVVVLALDRKRGVWKRL